jgi:hypothetical protein
MHPGVIREPQTSPYITSGRRSKVISPICLKQETVPRVVVSGAHKTKNRHLEVVWIDNTIWYTYVTMCAQQHRTPAERSLLTKPDIYKMVYLTQTTKMLVVPFHHFDFRLVKIKIHNKYGATVKVGVFSQHNSSIAAFGTI